MTKIININGQSVEVDDDDPRLPPAPTLTEAQSDKSAAVDDQRDAIIASGFTYDFGGSIGPKNLQTRDLTDITNWLTSQVAYTAAVGQGQGATLGASFRAADNTTFTVSYSAGLVALLAMASHGSAVYANSWSLKDRIAAATDQASLDAIDITVGWPS